MTDAEDRPTGAACPAYEQVFVRTSWPSRDDKWLCILKAEPDEIAHRTGLRFTDGVDDLDYFREAALRLASGRPVLLCRYLHDHGPGTAVSIDAADDAPGALAELSAAFELRMEDFVCINPEALGIEPPPIE